VQYVIQYLLLVISSYVFWFGDLNFRIEGLTYEEVLECIEDRKFDTLLERDQVTNVDIIDLKVKFMNSAK